MRVGRHRRCGGFEDGGSNKKNLWGWVRADNLNRATGYTIRSNSHERVDEAPVVACRYKLCGVHLRVLTHEVRHRQVVGSQRGVVQLLATRVVGTVGLNGACSIGVFDSVFTFATISL